MSFEARIGTYNGPTNKLHKDPATPTTYALTLRDECNIRDPEFLLKANLDDLAGKNYMTVPSWGRKYYITDIVSVRAGLVRISAHIDVLATYEDSIRAASGYVVRGQNGNKYIPDPVLALENRRDIHAAAFSGGFTEQTFVLATAGAK